MHPYYAETLLQERRNDMEREARTERLVAQAQAQAHVPAPQHRAAAFFGLALIRTGKRLTRYGVAHAA